MNQPVLGVDGPRDSELDAEAVSVEASALVARRDHGKAVGRLEAELVHEPDVHGKRAGRKTRGKVLEAMYIVLSKQPRKANRSKTKRYRAKLKAKDRGRRKRVYQLG